MAVAQLIALLAMLLPFKNYQVVDGAVLSSLKALLFHLKGLRKSHYINKIYISFLGIISVSNLFTHYKVIWRYVKVFEILVLKFSSLPPLQEGEKIICRFHFSSFLYKVKGKLIVYFGYVKFERREYLPIIPLISKSVVSGFEKRT